MNNDAPNLGPQKANPYYKYFDFKHRLQRQGQELNCQENSRFKNLWLI